MASDASTAANAPRSKKTALAVLVVAALVMAFLFRIGDNAKCPKCGAEFRIPEEHRGIPTQFEREYECPKCGTKTAAIYLYKE